ncbi:TonB-dependent receptor [Porifericola rhodea]|uniref:TonB-dependent receptor n=1 Tax=Porifericola rhodea TaxID=930972 RepID=UPI0026666340|nr:TonB-dependent receptor [Porifericola rhodea]WKN30651.1 TonB-dependent receptor [Porifericola rhodea]
MKTTFYCRWSATARHLILIFVLQSFFSTVLSANNLHAQLQNKSIEEIYISLQVENNLIKDVFNTISKQTGFSFAYNEAKVNLRKRISLDAQNASLADILREISKEADLKFKRVNEYIHVGKVEHQGEQMVEEKIVTQSINISGQVTSEEDGEGVPGVNVLVKDTNIGTVTDINGRYTLEVPDAESILVFSSIGFASEEILVGGQTTINVVLLPDIKALEEIVVVGYGTQKRATVTGSISTMQGEEIAEVPVPNISHSLAGRLAGVSMRPNGGQPGFDDPDIHIRGIVTTGNNKPLVVVDGVRRDNIRQIDPNTIDNITVLKDAAAVAPYGIGGANGVILITTKKGNYGKPQLSLSTSYGIQNPTYLPDMLSARDYMILQNEGYYNLNPNGTTPPNDPELIENYNQLHQEDPWKYPDSEFLDLFNTNVPVQNHNIDISGGNETLNYHAGFGFYDQQGIFDPVNYRRYNYNMSMELQATSTTTISMSLHGTVENTNDIDADEETSGHLFRSFYKFVPTQALIYPEGDKWGESSANSPVGVLRSDGYSKRDDNTLLSSISVEQQLPFVEGLSVKGVFSFDPKQRNQKKWHEPFIYHKIDLSEQPYTYTEAISLQEGAGAPYTWLELENNRWTNYTYQAYINYNRVFGPHNISGLVVAEARETTNDFFRTRRNNFAVEIDEMSLGSSDKQDYDNAGSSGTGSELGYVYRFGYTYNDKYIFEASGRYDGHYSFGPGKRWGYFPAFSAAWRISEEDFMSRFGSIDNLKIRGSWGKSGNLPYINGNLAAFQYLSGYDLRGNAYAFGNGTLVQGSRVPREANPYITWEISTKYDIGFDLSMWNGLVNVEFDYFHEDRTGMLLAPQVTLPVEYGLALSQENKGEMNNNGFEINIGTNKTFNSGLEMSIGANMSYSMNNMIEVFETDAERDNPNRTKVGRPFGTPYGFEALGLFTTEDDVNGDGIIDANDGYTIEQFGELHPGDIKYADLSGPEGVPDGRIDSNDETVIGYPVYPAMTFGLNSMFNWKGFDLSLFFQGSAMSSINVRQFMTVPFENNGSNTAYEYFDNRWTVDKQNAKYPRATPSPYANNTKNSDFWWVNSSYLRLKTAIIGYTLPKNFTDNLRIGSVRFYVTGQNLLTLSGIKHIDPEMGYEDRENAYPVMKSTTFGLDISF